MKVLVGAFNQEKALIGAFSVIVKTSRRFVNRSNWLTWLLGVDGEAAPVSDSVHALALAGLLLAMLAARDRVDRALPGFRPGQGGNGYCLRD